MVDQITFQTIFQFLQTAGLLVGIGYYVTTLRNAEKNRMKEMVFQRMQTRTPEYYLNIFESNPSLLEFETIEDYHSKYNWRTTPELLAKRYTIQSKLDAWGFLLKEGLIDLEFITQLHNPSFIVSWYEALEPIFVDNRKRGNPESNKEFEYLYKAIKKRHPQTKIDPLYNIKDITSGPIK